MRCARFFSCSSPPYIVSKHFNVDETPWWRKALIASRICLPLLVCSVAHTSTVHIESGKIHGSTIGDLTVYKGVPFAAPPLGNLRWREPQPFAPWDGVRAATSFAPACMQREVSMPGEAPQIITHPVLEPYNLPVSPYEAYVTRRQNDVAVLIGSNAEEARAMVDVTNVKASSYDSDITAALGQLPPALFNAYAHSTDAEARQARLDFERDLRFGWDMWAWARLQAVSSRNPVYYYYFQQRPPFPAGPVLGKLCQDGRPNGAGLPTSQPFTQRSSVVLHLGHPIASGTVPNLDGLEVFDAVYNYVRASPVWAAKIKIQAAHGRALARPRCDSLLSA